VVAQNYGIFAIRYVPPPNVAHTIDHMLEPALDEGRTGKQAIFDKKNPHQAEPDTDFFPQEYIGCYFLIYVTSLTALTTRSTFGRAAWISVGAYGNGTSADVIRTTGASK